MSKKELLERIENLEKSSKRLTDALGLLAEKLGYDIKEEDYIDTVPVLTMSNYRFVFYEKKVIKQRIVLEKVKK